MAFLAGEGSVEAGQGIRRLRVIESRLLPGLLSVAGPTVGTKEGALMRVLVARGARERGMSAFEGIAGIAVVESATPLVAPPHEGHLAPVMNDVAGHADLV